MVTFRLVGGCWIATTNRRRQQQQQNLRRFVQQFFFCCCSVVCLLLLLLSTCCTCFVITTSSSSSTPAIIVQPPVPDVLLLLNKNNNKNNNNNNPTSSFVKSSPTSASASASTTFQQQQRSSFVLHDSVSTWLLSLQQQQQQQQQQQTPSKQDITLLRSAFAEFYGTNRDLEKSLSLLSQTIDVWEQKKLPNDELSALHRVRADCHMLLGNAKDASDDYNVAVSLFRPFNDEDEYDEYDDQKQEFITALLGRARANKNLAQQQAKTTTTTTKEDDQQSTTRIKSLATQSVNDYKQALILSSRDEYDTTIESIMDGAIRNPYAAWEWGTTLRYVSQWEDASKAHIIASQSFNEIGDKARSIISLLDAGIDLAAAAAASTNANSNNKALLQQAETTLRNAIEQTKGISSRDIPLLRRVIAKEGEGRMALAATLWSNGQKQDAETYLGDACIRLEQMQAQVDIAAEKQMKITGKQPNSNSVTTTTTTIGAPLVDTNYANRVLYSIDDEITPAIGLSCSKFKSSAFMTEKLGWPASLQEKMMNLEKLKI